MSRRKGRFEKLEIESKKILRKPLEEDQAHFKRKLELGQEAKSQAIANDLEKVSRDLLEQVERNERQREIETQKKAVKIHEQVLKEQKFKLDLRIKYTKGRLQRARGELWFAAFLLFLFALAVYTQAYRGVGGSSLRFYRMH